jgi:hypothetical protein
VGESRWFWGARPGSGPMLPLHTGPWLSPDGHALPATARARRGPSRPRREHSAHTPPRWRTSARALTSERRRSREPPAERCPVLVPAGNLSAIGARKSGPQIGATLRGHRPALGRVTTRDGSASSSSPESLGSDAAIGAWVRPASQFLRTVDPVVAGSSPVTLAIFRSANACKLKGLRAFCVSGAPSPRVVAY